MTHKRSHHVAQPPQLVIFDKDGTLIDFGRMWGNWAVQFAQRISAAVHRDIRAAVLELYGVDATTHHIAPNGALAIAPMPLMQHLVAQYITPWQPSYADALLLVQRLWQEPDPVREALPLADLPVLCTWLHDQGIRMAVATADNRQPTLATLQHLGIAQYIGAVACADDAGIAPKPAPDKIFAVCRTLGVPPSAAIMVGDTPADMHMGRNARVMASVGVASGLTTAAELELLADVVLPNVGHLMSLWSAR